MSHRHGSGSSSSLPGHVAEGRRLSEAELEQVADLLADRFMRHLDASLFERTRLVDAHGLAELLAMSPSWIYEHQDELGVIRVGGAVRFNPERTLALLDARQADKGSQAPESLRRKRQRHERSAPARSLPDLLPIGGDEEDAA